MDMTRSFSQFDWLNKDQGIEYYITHQKGIEYYRYIEYVNMLHEINLLDYWCKKREHCY